ncbi:ABC transporter ATP-binding protein [uncultured Hydrogenophaga sp.]|uniref:ABC transporter ATP-binding protein n=1 Tax=uncultured Hydrogenophaga sp. TaxID=199683 RepID=UPI00265F2708|nr:ABC transporter ATP-binding protein [uncultured Hydrogenophaga sp.]
MTLQLHQLSKQYGSTRVFGGVNLRVDPGEFVAIVGESGVGKSSLLNCMAALDTWSEGHVTWTGADGKVTDLGALDDTGQALWRRAHLGFVFQAFHVLPHLDVAQNVALPLMLLGRSDPQRVEELLAAVGLQGLGHRLPAELSGGQLQRVAIARALVHRPGLVLADEPTGNLDPGTAATVMDVLQQQTRTHGAALILVTHSAGAAARAQRVLQLRADGLHPADTPQPVTAL